MSQRPPFKEVEASRPEWDESRRPTYTRTRKPSWTPGSGPNSNDHVGKSHVEIDPYAAGRPPQDNYKLLISAIVPRPIGFVSTISPDTNGDGAQTANLSPFSFFQMISFDPPLFILSTTGNKLGSNPPTKKDTARNILDTGECTINIISEHFLEAANFCSIDAPYGVSEFDIAGLTPAPSAIVKPPRVKEAVFSVEAKLVENREFHSRVDPSKVSATLLVLEGVRFWAREDAIDEKRTLIDIDKLRPMARLGGITYSRTNDLLEIPRPQWDNLSDEDKQRFSKKDR